MGNDFFCKNPIPEHYTDYMRGPYTFTTGCESVEGKPVPIRVRDAVIELILKVNHSEVLMSRIMAVAEKISQRYRDDAPGFNVEVVRMGDDGGRPISEMLGAIDKDLGLNLKMIETCIGYIENEINV